LFAGVAFRQAERGDTFDKALARLPAQFLGLRLGRIGTLRRASGEQGRIGFRFCG
jgi:hypothetical protein